MTIDIRRREVLGIMLGGAAGLAFAQNGPQFPKGAIIRTVLKDMKPEELAGGATLFHEHLSVAPDFMARWTANFRAISGRGGAAGRGSSTAPASTAARSNATPPAAPVSPQPFAMDDMDIMVDELKAAKADGVACIVDGGHEDMGRKIENLKIMSQRSGLPIVASGGYYSQPFYPAEIATLSEDEIVKKIVERATNQPLGALGEIGTWDVMTDDEKKVFRAVGRASIETNLAIFTHTNFGKGAVEQLDVFESVGVKPNRICIGHVGGLAEPDAPVPKEICKRGAYVGYDRQGGAGDARNVPQVKALIEAGYAANLLFASDLSTPQQFKKNNGPGYGKTLTIFVPKLKEAGVPEEVLHGITVDNPRRFLAFVPKKKRKEIA